MRLKLCIAFIWLPFVIVASKKSSVYFLSVNVQSNPLYLHQCEILIKPDNETLDIDFRVCHELNALRALISFTHIFQGKQNQSTDFQFDLPICEIMNNDLKSKSVLITNFSKSLFKQGTLPAKCPIAVGNYTWRDMRPRREYIPAYMLGGVYRLVFRLYTKHGVQGWNSGAQFLEKRDGISIIIVTMTFTLH